MRFVYLPGAAPATTVAFGVAFDANVPVDVTPALFPNAAAYDHAVRKLSLNAHFRVVPDPMVAVATLSEDEATQLVENVLDAPAPKKRGRPRKEATVIAEDMDAAE